MKKTLAGRVVLGLVLVSAPAGAQEKIDTSGILVKKLIADRMTADQLQAYKETLARRRAAGAFDRAPAGPHAGRAPGDICSAATHELGPLPYGPSADTTVGATDNYDLPPDDLDPTCTAAVACTGNGPAAAGPRGAIYNGTGTAPDRGWRIRTSANCALTITATPTTVWDLALVLYLGNCSSSLADCACVDDTGTAVLDPAETISLTAVAGTDYFVVVDGYSSGGVPPGPSGPYTLTVTGTGCALVPVELQGISIE